MPLPAPKFWWDFVGKNNDVIVQGDRPGGKRLAIFSGRAGSYWRDLEIVKAEALIADFTSGRKKQAWAK